MHRVNRGVILGACPTLTFLLRRTICGHLLRSRLEKILNVFQRICLRFFRACGLAPGHTSFASSRTAMSDRLLDRSIQEHYWCGRGLRGQATRGKRQGVPERISSLLLQPLVRLLPASRRTVMSLEG
jgi:hypothetical protein